MRGVIAKVLESKLKFLISIWKWIRCEPLAKARASINKQFADLDPEQGGFKLTVNDFILKATANALSRTQKSMLLGLAIALRSMEQ